MADNDAKLPRRIEAVFARTGLGKFDAEGLQEFQENYERQMTLADQMRKRKGTDFEDVLESAPEATPEEP